MRHTHRVFKFYRVFFLAAASTLLLSGCTKADISVGSVDLRVDAIGIAGDSPSKNPQDFQKVFSIKGECTQDTIAVYYRIDKSAPWTAIDSSNGRLDCASDGSFTVSINKPLTEIVSASGYSEGLEPTKVPTLTIEFVAKTTSYTSTVKTATATQVTGDDIAINAWDSSGESLLSLSIPDGFYFNKKVEMKKCPENQSFANDDVCSINAKGRYVTSHLGADVVRDFTTPSSNASGMAPSVSFPIPNGYYHDRSCKIQDPHFLASNIKKNVAIFGITGTLETAVPSCTPTNGGAALTNTCTAPMGSFVSVNQYGGRETVCAEGPNAGPCWIGSSSLFVLKPSQVAASNIHRAIGPTTATSQWQEAIAQSGQAYPATQAVPRIARDDEGFVRGTGSISLVDRSNWGDQNCGESGTTIEARIADCANKLGDHTTWEGEKRGNAGQGTWKLVTRLGGNVVGTGGTYSDAHVRGREVWRDERTKLVWSSRVALAVNWCFASGSNNNSGNPSREYDPAHICNTNQAGGGAKAYSACYEGIDLDSSDNPVHFSDVHTDLSRLGKGNLNLSSSPRVAWRLPTAYDYMQAEINGIRFVMPDLMLPGSDQNFEWTATIISNSDSRKNAWRYEPGRGRLREGDGDRNDLLPVRCVGR